jgi:hypothetical protein
MKKVRYLAGIVGIAPAVAGFIAPAAAHAATMTPTGDTRAKMVSLDATKPAATGCTGHTQVTAKNKRGTIKEKYWHTGGCVGDVDESLHLVNMQGGTLCVNYIMNIYAHGKHAGGQNWDHCFTTSGWHEHTFFVHKRFATPVEVCVKASASNGVAWSPACKTVS